MSELEVKVKADVDNQPGNVDSPAGDRVQETDASAVAKLDPQGDNAGLTNSAVAQNDAPPVNASNGKVEAGPPATTAVKQAVKATSDVARKGLSAVKTHVAPTDKTNAPKTPLVRKVCTLDILREAKQLIRLT